MQRWLFRSVLCSLFFDQFRRWRFRSVVLDRSLVCFSISCKGNNSISCAWYSNNCPFFNQWYEGEFFNQLCLIFNQFCVFQSVASTTFPISCVTFSISYETVIDIRLVVCVTFSILSKFDQLFVLFNQLYMRLFPSIEFDIQSVVCFT